MIMKEDREIEKNEQKKKAKRTPKNYPKAQ